MRIHSVVILTPFIAASLFAQEFRGTFSGMVTDPQGAAVPKAKILALETRTGVKTTAVSEDTGAYTLPFLPPGQYEISAEAPGFKRSVRQGLTLSAGEHPVIDFRLEVGAASDSVTVSSDAPLVVASNASIGQVVTTQEVEALPVNGRAPVTLMALAMGVLSTIEPGPTRPFDLPGGGYTVGGISGSNEVQLNGAPNTSASTGVASAYSPPQDAVLEVATNVFQSDASYGHAGGGTVNLITRSGTNSFHGSAYDFNQVSYLDANSFFANKAGSPRPGYNYNQYGLTAGGPVWIPKLFNGRNRVFWFFGYEGLRDSDPATSPLETGTPAYLGTVPTAAERQGDFSALLKANRPGVDYTIYDPKTGVASGSQIARTPFPNNVIPSDRLNAVALKYLQFFPQPNTPGQADGFQNYVINAVDSDGYDNELGRLDLNLSQKNRITYDFRHSNRTQNKNDFFHNLATGNFLYRVNQGTSLDDVYTVTPTMVLDVRLNWTRFLAQHTAPSDNFDPTSLGFPSYVSGNSQLLTLPFLTFSSCSVSAGSAQSFQCLGYSGDDLSVNDSFQIFGDVVKIRGNHSLKLGADLREYRLSSYTNGFSAGAYTFNASSNTAPNATTISQTWTNGPLNTASPSPLGQDFAAFLLGLPSSGQFDRNSYATASSRYYSFFVQDDWRARPNLTINLGLRWEHETPSTERFNRAVNGFDPTAANPVSGPAAAAYTANPVPQLPASQFKALGGLTFAGAGNRDIYSSKSSIFSPRFGISWTPRALGGKTVIRAGFGVFVSPLGITGLNQPGFSQTTQFVATNNNYLSPSSTLSDPFPAGILPPAGASKGTGTFLGQQVTFYNPQARDPYSLRWNIGVQRELPGQLVMEVAYIGNHAVRMIGNIQLDYLPRQYLSTSPVRDNAAINLLTGTVPNPFRGLLPNSTSLNGSTVALQQLLAPFPQYPLGSGTSNGVILQGANAYSSYYHSLNVRVQKRLTQGLTLINNFIWSQLIEHSGYLNDSDPVPEKRVSSISRPLHEVLAASYELPIGRGRRVDIARRLPNAILGGWALNGALTLQTGPPLSWGNIIYYGGPLNLNVHQPDGAAFDVTQFNRVSNQQLSNNIRTFNTFYNNLRRDPTKNLDLSILKKFSLGERRYLQVRFESFNTTNRVTFGAPNLTPTAATFGQILTQSNTPRRIQTGARLVW
ncbi:MAG: hypothetical protein JWP63_3891 [Candidatus Solibacter sp.]|nr:hypothetical protein [Candidatus Solibacter sp.]